MADLLIKGMDMPKNCGTCPLRHGDCLHRIYMEKRPDGCPLIEVERYQSVNVKTGEVKNRWAEVE